MVFRSEFVPDEKESIKSILDYSISINKLRDDQTHYMALGMNYSVTGFEMILQRKMSFYIVTYYLPSGMVITLRTRIVVYVRLLFLPQKFCQLYVIRALYVYQILKFKKE